MNKKAFAAVTSTLTSLVLFSAAGIAAAAPVNELYPANELAQAAPAAPVVTRSQVIEEFIAARAAGQIADGELGYALGTPAERAGTATVIAGKTRAEVIAELRQSRNDGSLVTTGESDPFPQVAKASSARSRAEVRAEAIQSAHYSNSVDNARGN